MTRAVTHASQRAGMAPLAGAAAVTLGTAADACFGDPRRGHPVALFGTAAQRLERLLWRPTRGAGAVYVALLVLPLAGAAALLERRAGTAVRVLARAVALWACLGGRSLAREAQAVDALVTAGDLPGARRRIRSLVGRDPERLDATELRRATIESLGENTADAVVASQLWLALGGVPGVLAHRAINTLDAMVGNRSPRHARFGTPAARLDDVVNWPAARIGGLLTVALAPLVGGSPRTALRAWRADAAAHPSPNAGVAEAAFAGALDVRLGGTLSYAGRTEHRPLLHAGGRDPGAGDVARAVRLARATGLASAAAGVLIGAAMPSRRRPA